MIRSLGSGGSHVSLSSMKTIVQYDDRKALTVIGMRAQPSGIGAHSSPCQQRLTTWTPTVCRIIAFYRFWAIILPTFRGSR